MSESSTSVPADAAELPGLTRFLKDFWSRSALPEGDAAAFELALEEVFMNVVMHGSPGAERPRVAVSLTLGDARVTLTVEDDGGPFDPLSLPQPDLGAGLDDRPVGGLGVFLVRRMMDSVHYQRRGTRNCLTMSKHLAPVRPASP